MQSLVLSADKPLLSGLDADSLLSKQEIKLDLCFSYLEDIDRNVGVSKGKNCWLYFTRSVSSAINTYIASICPG